MRCATTPPPSPASPICWSCWPPSQGRRPEEVAGYYTQYGPLKADLAAAVVATVEPIQAAYRQWADDPGAVAKVLRTGAERADEVARGTLRRAYDAVGLVPPA